MIPSIQVLVISLPEATERRERLLSRLQLLSCDSVFVVEATKGAALSVDERQACYDDDSMRRNAGRSMTAGELGCALSHLRCYEVFLASDALWALVLEDDAELPDDLLPLLKGLTEQADGWGVDVFNLGPVRKFLYGKPRSIIGYRLIDPLRIWNAHAYVVNRNAAHAMLSMNNPVKFMADDWAAYRKGAGIRLAALDPFPCAQAAAFALTGLEQDRQVARKTHVPWGYYRLAHLIVKLRRRLVEFVLSFGRHVHSHQ